MDGWLLAWAIWAMEGPDHEAAGSLLRWRRSPGRMAVGESKLCAAVASPEAEAEFRGSAHLDLCEELWTTKMHSQLCRAFR
ncbi:hypothetical protein Taro_002061 [Colocasia esculenta]|uniref:Uncharacterized protein n=1 Tax=Colocasia esculenta TaxID=4460 RepID=A0A843TBR4_COLES|nr:hypothetical protein [Colocasia esculenta]